MANPPSSSRRHSSSWTTPSRKSSARFDEYAKKLIEEVNPGLPEGFKIYLCDSYYYVRTSHYDAPLAKAAGAHEREVREKRNAAIETILVELELGANKADLERLISEAINM